MLPPETEKIWRFLQQESGLAGFVLVGGSALALRIKHRLSEDLDLACCANSLPKHQLEAVWRNASKAQIHLERNDNEIAVQEFIQGGMELHDYQQDFIANSRVKISFFTADEPLAHILREPPETRVRIATLPELFKSKCVVSAQRSKTRDWLDLYLLMRDHGFTIEHYREAFREAGIESQADIGLVRLCSGVPQKNDEGYAHLDPPSLAEMKKFFIARRDELEVQLAARRADTTRK